MKTKTVKVNPTYLQSLIRRLDDAVEESCIFDSFDDAVDLVVGPYYEVLKVLRRLSQGDDVLDRDERL